MTEILNKSNELAKNNTPSAGYLQALTKTLYEDDNIKLLELGTEPDSDNITYAIDFSHDIVNNENGGITILNRVIVFSKNGIIVNTL